MTTTKVLTTLLVAAWFFANNLRFACAVLTESGLVAKMLSESQFSRRRHRITPQDWGAVLTMLEEQNPAETFAIDSCPLSVCHPRRATRSRLFEVMLLCGCCHDLTGRKEMLLPLPEGATLYADKADTDYAEEDELRTKKKITLLPIRKGNAKRRHPDELARALSRGRKRIETTFSQIGAKLPRKIHAVTPAGFESKVWATFVAFAILCAQCEKAVNKQRVTS